MKLCKCNCGNPVTKETNTYLKGHYTKGKKLSNDQKIKMSNSHKGQIPWIKGKTHSKEIRKKISESHKGMKLSESHKKNIGKSHIGISSGMKGKFAEKHPNWTGGTIEYWSRKLRKVNRECVLCKCIPIKGELHMHHKDKDITNNERSNLFIICKECHQFWHYN